MFENTLSDMIYHEHLSYHSVGPLVKFMAAHDMEVFDVLRVSTHGGSLRVMVQPKTGHQPVRGSVEDLISYERKIGLDQVDTFRDFGASIDNLGTEERSLLCDRRGEGRAIAAFGAPAKATTLMYHFGIGPNLIDFIVDDNPLKQGMYSPGMHIPVVPSSEIYDKNPNDILILAWNFAQSIIEKHKQFTLNGGHFIVPLPQLKII